MKQKFLLFLICCLANHVSAQTNFSITGSLPSAIQGNIQFAIDRTFLNREPEIITVPITMGKFEIKTKLERNCIVQLVNPGFRFPLYAEPGFEMTLNIPEEANTFANALAGKGAEENNFLQEFFNKFGADFNDSLNEGQMLLATIDGYESNLFNKKKEHLDFVKANEKYKSMSSDFKAFVENEISYHYWRELFAYPIINANRDSKILTVIPLPQVMLDNFSSVKINNEPAMLSGSYRDFVKYHIIYSASKANGFNKFTDPTLSAEKKLSVAREKLEGNIFVYWLSRYTIEECGNLGGMMVKKLLSSLKDADVKKNSYNIVEPYCNSKAISTETASIKQQAGNPPAKQNSSDAGLVDLDGKPVTLDKLKGKATYIDFWASWCGPCRMMMPYSKQMHDGLTEKQKKQINFVYISIDADTNAWKKAMRDLGMEGIQYISPGNWNSKACKYFQINSIPRYMIMNKKGEIVNMNAPRPSDPAVLQELLRLAEEK